MPRPRLSKSSASSRASSAASSAASSSKSSSSRRCARNCRCRSSGGRAGDDYESEAFAAIHTVADQAISLFFENVFGTTVSRRQTEEERSDMRVDLIRIFSDYAGEITEANYNRLRDDSALFDMKHDGKTAYGPEHLYYERQFPSDDEDSEDEEDSEEDEDEDESPPSTAPSSPSPKIVASPASLSVPSSPELAAPVTVAVADAADTEA